MKIVVGGTELIRLKLVKKLREHGQEVVAAVPTSGVNTLTGEGLADAVKGAFVVVDQTNSPHGSFSGAVALHRPGASRPPQSQGAPVRKFDLVTSGDVIGNVTVALREDKF